MRRYAGGTGRAAQGMLFATILSMLGDPTAGMHEMGAGRLYQQPNTQIWGLSLEVDKCMRAEN